MREAMIETRDNQLMTGICLLTGRALDPCEFDKLHRHSCDFVIRQIFMARHVRPHQAELDDFSEPMHPPTCRQLHRDINAWPGDKIRRQTLKAALPCLPGQTVGCVTGRAMHLQKHLSIESLRRRNAGIRELSRFVSNHKMCPDVGFAETLHIGQQSFSAGIGEKTGVRGHWRIMTQHCRINKMRLQPKR